MRSPLLLLLFLLQLSSFASAFKHEASCQCGKVRIGLTTDPFIKYNCHCSNCRSFVAPADYLVGAAVWRWTVAIQGLEHLEYTKTQTKGLAGFGGLQRGKCRHCNDHMWERGTGVFACYGMVMAKSFHNNTIVADTNLYYNSGHQRGPTLDRTLQTDIGSLLYECKAVLTKGSFVGLFRKQFPKKVGQ